MDFGCNDSKILSSVWCYLLIFTIMGVIKYPCQKYRWINNHKNSKKVELRWKCLFKISQKCVFVQQKSSCLCLPHGIEKERQKSYLCFAPWQIPMWLLDCIMKLDDANAQMLLWASGWQKSLLLELCYNVFLCVGVCRRQRKSESSSQDSLLFSMCHAAGTGG